MLHANNTQYRLMCVIHCVPCTGSARKYKESGVTHFFFTSGSKF
jgi:hypothetical protein